MKDIVIIGSYANTEKKLELVEQCILNSKKLGFDVLLYAKYPVTDKIYGLCDYFIFDKSNPMVPDRVFTVWRLWANKRMVHVKEEYGFAAIEQIINGLGFAYNLNYDFAHFINYDVDLTDFTEYHQRMKDLITENDVVAHPFGRYDENVGVLCTQLYFNVQKSFKALNPVINLNHYKSFTVNTGRLAEAFFHNCLTVSNLKFHEILGANLPELFTEQADRLHGTIIDKHATLLKYFNFLHLGSVSENPSLKKILIYEIHTEIQSLIVDIGTEILVFDNLQLTTLNHYNFYEIDLIDKNPTKFTILQINDETMNEQLDENLDDKYWASNFIFDN